MKYTIWVGSRACAPKMVEDMATISVEEVARALQKPLPEIKKLLSSSWETLKQHCFEYEGTLELNSTAIALLPFLLGDMSVIERAVTIQNGLATFHQTMQSDTVEKKPETTIKKFEEFPKPNDLEAPPIENLIHQRFEAGIRYELMLDINENPTSEERSKWWRKIDRRFLARYRIKLRVRRENYNKRREALPRGEKGKRWSRVDVAVSLGKEQSLYDVVCEVLPIPAR